jgi:hypothetical protein
MKIILYYDARSKKHQNEFCCHYHAVRLAFYFHIISTMHGQNHIKQTLAVHVQDRPLHLDMYVNLLHLSAIPFNPSSSRLEHPDRFNNTMEVMEGR